MRTVAPGRRLVGTVPAAGMLSAKFDCALLGLASDTPALARIPIHEPPLGEI